MIRPEHFKQYIYPSYKKIFNEAKSGGALVRLHTDGRIIELVDLLIDTNIDILNIQDKVNGIENTSKLLKGRICIVIDIDRQHLIPYATPKEIQEYIRYVINEIDTPKGGLMVYAEVHPPTPLENIKALANALYNYMWKQK